MFIPGCLFRFGNTLLNPNPVDELLPSFNFDQAKLILYDITFLSFLSFIIISFYSCQKDVHSNSLSSLNVSDLQQTNGAVKLPTIVKSSTTNPVHC
jgi:hypothetical protein